MIPSLHSGETYIDRLRIHCVGVDPIRARLQLSSLLNTGFPQARIAPSAIVFIRKMRDPMPGVLRLDQDGGYLPDRWNDALAESFHKLVSSAVCPAVGSVTGSEEAVIFRDRSELLACLATDLCQGTIAARWWWRGLLKGGSVSKLVTELWRDRPEYIPAALEHLSNRKLLVDFVRALGDAEVRDLAQRVARTFGLHALSSLLTVSLDKPVNVETTAIASPTRPPGEIERGEITEQSPWLGWLGWSPWLDWIGPNQAQRLRPEAERLLGIALMLIHEPTHARTLRFAREVEAWQSLLSLSVPAPKRPQVNIAEVTPRPIHASTAAHYDIERPAQPEASLDFASSSSESEKIGQRFRDKRGEFGEQLHTDEITPVELRAEAESGAFGSADLVAESLIDDADDGRKANVDVSPARDEASDRVSALEVETQLGGLFYLINLGIYLNLYGDFTMPAKPGIELNIWDFVALVGAELIGSNDDPIWPFLAQLAGRQADQAPGEGFAPADSWRIEPEWLTHFSSPEPWTLSSSDDRLRLLHSAGFLVLDLPLDSSDPDRQLRVEIENYKSVLSAPLNLKPSNGAVVNIDSETVTRDATPEVRAWLARLMPYVRARLRAALDLGTEDELASLVCRRFARVDATETHVEVFFGLADLPLEIRLAGLDRDPGWVPAAGRFIAFHFD